MCDLKKHRDELQNTVFFARAHYDIWWIYRSSEEYNTVQNEFYWFFRVSRDAHYVAMIIALYRLFETRAGTFNIGKLLELAKKKNLLENNVSDGLDTKVKDAKEIWKKAGILRHNLFAHRNIEYSYEKIYEKAGIAPINFKNLTEISLEILNDISCALGDTRKEFTDFSPHPADDARRILDVLKTHISSK